jgi:hypothetical protein
MSKGPGNVMELASLLLLVALLPAPRPGTGLLRPLRFPVETGLRGAP